MLKYHIVMHNGRMNKKPMYIFGLGNPGAEYDGTRHNAGRAAVELLAQNNNFPAFKEEKKLYALAAEGIIEKQPTLLLLPETFMNNSGRTAAALKIPSKKQIVEHIIVVHDDLDLPLGTVKLVFNRGTAGHKGVASIAHALKTKEFTRVRIGIAKASDIKKSQNKTTVHTIVVGKISPADKAILAKSIKKAASAVEAVLRGGLASAMNAVNSKE